MRMKTILCARGGTRRSRAVTPLSHPPTAATLSSTLTRITPQPLHRLGLGRLAKRPPSPARQSPWHRAKINAVASISGRSRQACHPGLMLAVPHPHLPPPGPKVVLLPSSPPCLPGVDDSLIVATPVPLVSLNGGGGMVQAWVAQKTRKRDILRVFSMSDL